MRGGGAGQVCWVGSPPNALSNLFHLSSAARAASTFAASAAAAAAAAASPVPVSMASGRKLLPQLPRLPQLPQQQQRPQLHFCSRFFLLFASVCWM